MSMMGEFREIPEEVLDRLKAKPELVDSVVMADLPSDDAVPGFEALVQAMPPKQREMMRALQASMTPDERSRMLETSAQAAASLKSMAAHFKSQAAGEAIARDQLGERLSIEKAWHGVHYLLCGAADAAPGSLGQAILGGTEIGPDRGYGPARYLTAQEVREVAEGLSQVTKEVLLERYDPDTMDRLKVYPGHWSDPENREWLTEAFADVLDFYTSVAARGNAVLLYLT